MNNSATETMEDPLMIPSQPPILAKRKIYRFSIDI